LDIKFDQSSTPFNLENTLTCGQVFRWRKLGEQWYGVFKENVTKIRQCREKIRCFTFPEQMDENSIKEYFGIDDDLPTILLQINMDDHIKKATQHLNGLRILRQDPWECLISYVCATYTNISAVKNMIDNLSKAFGRKLIFDGHVFYTFPTPSDLAQADLIDLKDCKLGFRAENVLKISQILDRKEFKLDLLKEMTYQRAKLELMSMPGIGQKVADCILLFSLKKFEAFPVDVWIKRIILTLYSEYFERFFIQRILTKKTITPKEYEIIASFGRRYFGQYAGYAQEYLYSFYRTPQSNIPNNQ
jgi:N-glycosylase/DNA lyase